MSTVGYRSAAAHLEHELARAELLLRSAVALHVACLAGDTDSLRWGLSEVTPGEVATYLSAPPPPARQDFDDDHRAIGTEHVGTPVTTAQPVTRLPLQKKKII